MSDKTYDDMVDEATARLGKRLGGIKMPTAVKHTAKPKPEDEAIVAEIRRMAVKDADACRICTLLSPTRANRKHDPDLMHTDTLVTEAAIVALDPDHRELVNGLAQRIAA